MWKPKLEKIKYTQTSSQLVGNGEWLELSEVSSPTTRDIFKFVVFRSKHSTLKTGIYLISLHVWPFAIVDVFRSWRRIPCNSSHDHYIQARKTFLRENPPVKSYIPLLTTSTLHLRHRIGSEDCWTNYVRFVAT